jgi:hypothetical protein
MAVQHRFVAKPVSQREDRNTIVLTPEGTAAFDAAAKGEDGWRPNEYLLRGAEDYNKAVAEGLIKAR